ncbi:MAG: DUF4876 domain-containing protein [Dysgonamonadaceae bacterium]|jgi:hypothetical protein|nr:DUF4876 domain-containing protein [Dysgonamonadaceae bacterium]
MKSKKNIVKQIFSLALIGLFLATVHSCDEKNENIKTIDVKVRLIYPDGYEPKAGVPVKLTGNYAVFESQTDASGVAGFTVTVGLYEAMSFESYLEDKNYILFNGTKSNIVVNESLSQNIFDMNLTESKTSQLVIKEIYNGGCQKDDGSGAFQNDKYVILYNNSSEPVSLKNYCLGACLPSNGHATNNFISGGELIYKQQGWIPAGFGIWALESDVSLDPGKQIVIALENAIDNTQTYSKSVNLADAGYYAAYDIAVWPNTTYYKVADVIPGNHYLKAYKIAGASGNAWSLSVSSPAFFVFQTKGVTPAAFANNADNIVLHGTSASQVNLKTPVDWIIDGIEIFLKGQEANSKKRLTDNVDAGYIYLTNNQGYTLYRNVDQTATEAIPENAGKIVYDYNKGTADIEGGATDPSSIDAEASLKLGARIIYKDTNNSAADFHQRKQASLKNN